MSHNVTITRRPDETTDDYEYTFGGTHGHDCQVFAPCKRAACQRMDPNHAAGYERVRHGREHFHRDGEWMVEQDDCALRFVFESVTEWESFDGIPLGTHPVIVCWEDESWWVEVQYTPPAPDGQEKNR